MIRSFQLIFIALLFVGCFGGEKKQTHRIVYLSAQEGSIRLKRGLTSYYTISLHRPAQSTYVFYTDPLDDVEPVYLNRFVEYWNSDTSGLSSGAPGAALIIEKENGETVPFLFKVQDPEFDPQTNTLYFDAHTSQELEESILKEAKGKITMFIET